MLYTRKGDNGTSKLYNCPNSHRLSKGDRIFEVLGSLDELNSQIGYAKVLAKKEKIKLKLKKQSKSQLPFSQVLPRPSGNGQGGSPSAQPDRSKKALDSSLYSENYFFSSKNYEDILEDIQNMIFILQASFAGSDMKLKEEDILFLENIIDSIEGEIPKINSFLIAGHTELSAFLDILRANSRKVERKCVKLKENSNYKIEENHLIFLNRLSSFFYALERYVNYSKKHKEKSPKY